MFTPVKPYSHMRKTREMIWPSMGWRRTKRYWKHRLVRIRDSTAKISAGLAMGAAVSFVPAPGTHIIAAAGLSWIFRANIFASIMGTLAGNPWTLPLMWWLAYKIGGAAFNMMGYHVGHMPENFFSDFQWGVLVDEIGHDPMRLIAPWFVGGVILMMISWPIFYFFFFGLITNLRASHHTWKETRLHKEARSITGQSA